MRRTRWLFLIGLLTVGVLASAPIWCRLFELALLQTHTVVEQVLGETPQAKVAAYLGAVQQGNRGAALNAWPANEQWGAHYEARRQQVTSELLVLGSSLRYRVVKTEWWSNCCEPGPVSDPSSAGVARMHIEIKNAQGYSQLYVFDVATTQPYWGAAGGSPVRRWVLRDVYPVSERPIAFPWPLPTAVPVLQPTAGQTAVLSTPRSTPSPAATMALPMPTVTWTTYTNPLFGITLQYPAHWQPKPGYERRFAGPDGFFQLDAISGEASTIDQVTESEAYHKLKPYGSVPRIEKLQVQGREARLISPSADQPESMDNQAGLIIQLLQPVEISGQKYNYLILWADRNHIREIAQTIKLDMSITLIWAGQQIDGSQQSLYLAADGRAAITPDDALHTPLHILDAVDRPQQWNCWQERFAPFEADTPAGHIIFRGHGQEIATPAWQRAIAAWARLVQQEIQFGRSGASWGAALSWRQEMPERPGYCKFLHVEVYGMAYASTGRCSGGDAQDVGYGWLEAAEWEQFDTWFYGRAPLYLGQLPMYVLGLDLFAVGSQEMDESEIADLQRWVEAVYTRLAARELSAE